MYYICFVLCFFSPDTSQISLPIQIQLLKWFDLITGT